MIWPPIHYSYQTANSNLPQGISAPTAPFWLMTKEQRCSGYAQGVADPNCTWSNLNWLGTDDQARDVFARMIYGFRISVLFGLALTICSAVVGVAAGAVRTISAAGRTFCCSASSRYGRRCRCSISC